jgi:RimJ/RimL family protein N-acetyltransferase
VDLHNDPVVLRNLTDPSPVTLVSHLKWWEQIKNNPCQLRLIYVVDGERAGLTKFYDIDLNNHSCMLGADLHIDFRNKSLAKPMWKLMLDLCFETMKLHRVSLTTAQFNVPAQRVYSGLGFKEEGRLVQSLFRDGQYYDQVMMYMLRSDWSLLVKT